MRSGHSSAIVRAVVALALAVPVSACAAASTSDTPPAWAPVAGMSRVTLDGVARSYAELLGTERTVIETALRPTGSGRGEWVEYGDDLRIAYEDGIAVRLRARTPQQFDCIEAARWMGFPLPRRPIVDGRRCTWPGTRVHDTLEKGYGGEYRFDMQWFLIWRRDDAAQPSELGHTQQ